MKETVLTVSTLTFAVFGLILIGVSIFSEPRVSWALPAALSAILVSNLLNLIRLKARKGSRGRLFLKNEKEM